MVAKSPAGNGQLREKVFLGMLIRVCTTRLQARLYRTVIAVLTQFLFGYLYRLHGRWHIEASAELDRGGIDFLLRDRRNESLAVALQIKKRDLPKGSPNCGALRCASLACKSPYY